MSPAFHATQLSPLDILLQDKFVTNLTDELEEVDSTPFARGGFSFVYKYKARPFSSISLETGNSSFAVKAIRWVDEKKERKLEREIRNWAKLNHENVLKLRGIVARRDARVSLVSDFMYHGTAVDYLNGARKGNIIDVSREIANGLAFLHANSIVHGDIKGDNILINSCGRACIGDFGLSRVLRSDGTSSASTTDANRACRWTAAENLDFANESFAPSPESDVWSFGCTILQLISGELPYYDIPNFGRFEGQVVLRIQSGELPRFPPVFHRDDFEKYRDGISAFCELCWIKDRASRPPISTLLHILHSFCLDMHCHVRVKDLDEPSTSLSDDYSISSGSFSTDQLETSNISDNNGFAISGKSSEESRSRSSSQSTIGPEASHQKTDTSDGYIEESGSRDQEDVSETQTEIIVDNSKLHNLFSTLPPPPLPSIESILNFQRKAAQVALSELCQKNPEILVEYLNGESGGNGNHVIICNINGEVFGTGSVNGRKSQAKERAAKSALKRLYVEKPDYFAVPAYRFGPILNNHLANHQISDRATWISHSIPIVDNPGGWIFRSTFKFDGIPVAEIDGSTSSMVEEEVAREVANIWNCAAGNSA